MFISRAVRLQPLPVRPVAVTLGEEHPVEQVPHADLGRREVRRGVTQQEQRVEVGGRQNDRRAFDVDLLAGLRRIGAEHAFQLPVRGVGVDVQEVVVVLDHHPVDAEYGVEVFLLVDRDPLFAAQQGVGLLLPAVEPDVDIAAGPVLGHRVAEAQAVALEQHGTDAVLCVECREAADRTPLPRVAAFVLRGVETPADAQLARRRPVGGQATRLFEQPQSVPCDPQHALRRGEAVERVPRRRRKAGEGFVSRAGTSERPAQQQEQRFAHRAIFRHTSSHSIVHRFRRR